MARKGDDSNGPSKVKRSRVKGSGYTKMIEYMERKENFAILHGTGGKTKIGGKLVTKTSAFRTMAVTLGDLGWHEVRDLNGEAMKKKWDRYLDKYKKAKILLSESGGGLSEAEIKAGLTMEEKAELKCPNFRRMDELFGGRSNMDVPAEGCLGVPNKFDVSSGSEDSNDEGAGEFDEEQDTCQANDELPDGECGESSIAVETLLTQPVNATGGSCGEATICGEPLTQPSLKVTGDVPQKKKKKSVVLEEKPTPRTTLLAMYGKTLDNTAAYREKMVESKERLKLLELAEQRELQKKAERALNKRAKTDRSHELELAKLERKMQMISELAKCGKSPEEVSEWIHLLEF